MKIAITILLILLKHSAAFSQPTDEVPPDPGLSNSISNESILKVYPVPSTGKFAVNLIDHVKKGTSIMVFDRNGRLVLSQKTETPNIQFDLTNYPKGLCFVRVNDDKKKTPVKVLIN